MSPDLMFWLALPMKMAATAALVVFATLAAERFGPLLGAMVATLPISAGPAYVFVGLDHDAAFIAASALGSLACNAANIVFCTVYTVIAQSRGLTTSLSAALGSWIAVAGLSRFVDWTVSSATALNILVLMICLPVGRRFRDAPMPATIRRWYDLPLRAAMVATLVATVVVLSSRVGPVLTGILALFPVALTSLVLIFQPRVGGPATAAITANGIPGLAGYGLALLALNLAAVPVGTPAALTLALGVSITWNLIILALRRRGIVIERRLSGPSSPPRNRSV
jgi:hypothetical protein